MQKHYTQVSSGAIVFYPLFSKRPYTLSCYITDIILPQQTEGDFVQHI